MKSAQFVPVASIHASKGRIPGLDGLRAISILIVMLSHFDMPRLPGGYGVFIFFVLSGFLITRLSFLEVEVTGRFSIKDFYLRRLFRLYPVVIAYVVAVCAAYYVAGHKIDPLDPLSVLFYFVNYLYSIRQSMGIDPAMEMPMSMFWSLSVEEHFYLVFPWIFVASALRRGGARRILIAGTIAILLAFGLRVVGQVFWPEVVRDHVLNMQTQFRIDAIAYGVCLAALCQMTSMHPLIKRCGSMTGLLCAATLIFFALAMPSIWKRHVFDVFFGLGISIAIAAIAFSGVPRAFALFLNTSVMEWIGRLSYSLYVWHIAAHMLAQRIMPGEWWLSAVLSFALASASYYLIERPFLRLKPARKEHLEVASTEASSPIPRA